MLIYEDESSWAAVGQQEAASWTNTDWSEVVGLYDLLVALWPSPVVALNRAVAVGLAHGPAVGLAALDALAVEPQLAEQLPPRPR